MRLVLLPFVFAQVAVAISRAETPVRLLVLPLRFLVDAAAVVVFDALAPGETQGSIRADFIRRFAEQTFEVADALAVLTGRVRISGMISIAPSLLVDVTDAVVLAIQITLCFAVGTAVALRATAEIGRRLVPLSVGEVLVVGRHHTQATITIVVVAAAGGVDDQAAIPAARNEEDEDAQNEPDPRQLRFATAIPVEYASSCSHTGSWIANLMVRSLGSWSVNKSSSNNSEARWPAV